MRATVGGMTTADDGLSAGDGGMDSENGYHLHSVDGMTAGDGNLTAGDGNLSSGDG